jgi:uncharacterized membrane protein YedE/YeeE
MTVRILEKKPRNVSGETRKPRPFWQNLTFFVIGIYLGIVLIKSQAISWYRIQEMFHFQSIFMFGVLGTAILVGALSIMLIKAAKLHSLGGDPFDLSKKPFNKVGNAAGGTIFGFGWALTGACPGPLYALLGAGYWSILLAIVGALLGALAYGYAKPRLPH